MSSDPKALQNLNINLQQKHDQRTKPSSYQCSELSPLQKLVKDARRTILDPVLAIYEGMSEPEDEPEEKLNPEEIRRQLEKEKLRELKKRKIHTYGGLSLPSRGVLGVYIRHDVEDESPDVDITLDTSAIDIDVFPPPPPPSKRLPVPPIRSRKPSVKAQTEKKPSTVPQKRKAKSPSPSERGSSPEPPSKPKRAKDKPKPETYKQQWSVSEQHLLEQLLDQIPEGEKNRWQKISRAMNGKRTPRQVASRVQKYFAKLKRFGV
ncbi:hypothetical protein C0991_001292 [Blastosporella zonata]|nr:hypothetical protein C0991_001292 [Blastosporella zonata]